MSSFAQYPERWLLALAAIGLAGLSTRVLGSLLHQREGRHGDVICEWCELSGRNTARALARRGYLVIYKYGPLWYRAYPADAVTEGFPAFPGEIVDLTVPFEDGADDDGDDDAWWVVEL